MTYNVLPVQNFTDICQPILDMTLVNRHNIPILLFILSTPCKKGIKEFIMT